MYLLEQLRSLVHRFLPGVSELRAHLKKRNYWDEQWGSPNYAPGWLGRPVSRETIAAVEENWFPAGGNVLDIGCGRGDVVRWLFERGFTVEGIDISPVVISQAQEMFGRQDGLRYTALDICRTMPSHGPYSIFIDRGCLHQIPEHLVDRYVNHILKISTDDARFLLFIKAFRGKLGADDRLQELHRWTDFIERSFAGKFTVERSAETFLDHLEGADPEQALPGLVFWLRRI